jgi:hypothetical protein
MEGVRKVMSTSLFDWRAHLKVHPAADLFPLMSESELKELADDIQQNGVRTPIQFWIDEDDKEWLLDGRNRLDALATLGLLKIDDDGSVDSILSGYVTWFVYDRNGADPYAAALSLNIHRRHLTAEQKRDLIAKLLKAQPQTSDRAIAKSANVDHKTVGAVREKLKSTGEIPQLEKTVGADGKSRKKPIHWQQRVHINVAYPAARRGVTARTIIEEREAAPERTPKPIFDYDPKYDPENNSAIDTPEDIWRRGLMFRASESAAMATYKHWEKEHANWHKFDVPDEALSLAMEAAKAWAELVDVLKAQRTVADLRKAAA